MELIQFEKCDHFNELIFYLHQKKWSMRYEQEMDRLIPFLIESLNFLHRHGYRGPELDYLAELMFIAEVKTDGWGAMNYSIPRLRKIWRRIVERLNDSDFDSAYRLAFKCVDYSDPISTVVFSYYDPIPADWMLDYLDRNHCVYSLSDESQFLVSIIRLFPRIEGDYYSVHRSCLKRIRDIDDQFYPIAPLRQIPAALYKRKEYGWAFEFDYRLDAAESVRQFWEDPTVFHDWGYRNDDHERVYDRSWLQQAGRDFRDHRRQEAVAGLKRAWDQPLIHGKDRHPLTVFCAHYLACFGRDYEMEKELFRLMNPAEQAIHIRLKGIHKPDKPLRCRWMISDPRC
ncbi:MAG: hypothetical protein KBA26_12605 [Candidatus Delongbacteria bacterium]|nr:hypothetical protein [Candidatus Delongbacteria bacterium]